MIEDIPDTLSTDTICIMGVVEKDIYGATKHTSYSYTMEQVCDIDRLCGIRADWIIWLDRVPPPEPFYSNVLKPFLHAFAQKDFAYIRDTGHRKSKPVIYHAPMTKLT